MCARGAEGFIDRRPAPDRPRSWARLGVRVAVVTVAIMTGTGASALMATEWTQILNNAELLRIHVQQAEQLAVQMRQYENTLRQARRLDPRAAIAAVEDLRRLVEIISTSKGVAVGAGDVDERFRQEFPGFDEYAGGREESYEDRYRGWNEVNRESIRGALRAADLHAAEFYDEAATLRAVERDSVDAQGMMQIMQAMARIATVQAEQMMRLGALLTAQVQMQANVAASADDRQAFDDAKDAALLRRTLVDLGNEPTLDSENMGRRREP